MNIIENNLNFKTLTKRESTDGIFLHHRAGDGDVESIHQQHLKQGWSGIGYHFYVRKNGEIHRGRPEWAIGAHVSGHNYHTSGICAEGNFETDQMPDAQKNAICDLIAYLKTRYSIKFVKKHSDVSKTSCPGRNYPFDEIVGSNAQSKVEIKTVPNIAGKREIVCEGQKLANQFVGEDVPDIKEDGLRGPETMKLGVMVLQHAMNLDYGVGIAVDGYFETKSKAAFGRHYVTYGETQYMVSALEILLKLKGYDCQFECPGVFLNNLKKVFLQYQHDYKLTEDCTAGYHSFMSLIH